MHTNTHPYLSSVNVIITEGQKTSQCRSPLRCAQHYNISGFGKLWERDNIFPEILVRLFSRCSEASARYMNNRVSQEIKTLFKNFVLACFDCGM